jgi:type II secretory pathway pseudopilin PulG
MSNEEAVQDSGSGNGEKTPKPKLLRTWLRDKMGSGVWIGFVLEAGLIVLSVLLALAVNEWRAERKAAQKAQTALKAIHSELEANREEFKKAMQYHRMFRDTLHYYQKRDLTPPMRLLNQGIFQPATVSETAWETAKQSGVTDHFAYELVLDLSHFYQRQSDYNELSNAIGQQLYISSTMEKSPEELLRGKYENWISLLSDFSNSREQRLMKSATELLTKVEKAIKE